MQCLRYCFLKCPCTGDPSMTPNQSRFRASSFKGFSTTNSSGFTPKFWEWNLIPKHLQYVKLHLFTLVTSIEVWLPTNQGLGHWVLKIFTIYPSDVAWVSKQVQHFALFLFFFQLLIGLLSGVPTLLKRGKRYQVEIFLSLGGEIVFHLINRT